MDIRNVVSAVIHKYDSRNPFEIVEAKGAIVIFAPLIDVRGFYQYFQRNSIIYIDENLDYAEKNFVCAHELGHIMLHKKSNAVYMDTKAFFNSNKLEKEANIFATELLIPDEIILENYHYTIEQLSRLLGYEKKLIELRLESYQEI